VSWGSVLDLWVIIFVPKEIKTHEYRVGLVPAGVAQLAADGHQLLVETNAGFGAGISDREFSEAGATMVERARGFEQAALVVKVKEPQPSELALLRPGQMVFGYFHFAASRSLTEQFIATGATALAYETLVDELGRIPLLIPMSEVAGRMSIQQGAKLLENPGGGRGILLGGVPGTPPAHVTILGAGIVGTEAAKMAAGLGATVHLLDTNLHRLRALAEVLPKNVTLLASDRARILDELSVADLVIGAVLIKGARAPRLVTRADLKRMRPGSVIVDVAVDQGGCVETIHPTTHDAPSYVEEGIIHYGVANIPGAVSRTSTFALTNATLPYLRLLARHGFPDVCSVHPPFRSALNIAQGQIYDAGVAEFMGAAAKEFAPPAPTLTSLNIAG